MLLQSYLDGHPEILQDPGIFRFYDLRADHPELLEVAPSAAAVSIADYPNHARIFDTTGTVDGLGHLGPDHDTSVTVSRDAFASCLASLIASMDERSWGALRRATTLAYSWAAGLSWRDVYVIVQHLHHGDWLIPESVIDDFNLMDRTGRDVGQSDPLPDHLFVTRRSGLEAPPACRSHRPVPGARAHHAVHHRPAGAREGRGRAVRGRSLWPGSNSRHRRGR